MTKITKQPTRDLYAEITERIISRMEQGVAPWQKPWSHYGKAKNYATNHIYTGVNFILMNSAPYEIPYYLSFKQAQELGGKVKKGAKAEFVVYFNVYFKDGEKTITQAEAQGREGIEVRKFLKHYCVFNISDIEGIDFKLPDLVLRDNDRFEHCDAIVRNYPTPPKIQEVDKNRAYYMPSADLVNMPTIEQFTSSETYYSTFFHELIHSTGHAKRLNREELVNSDGFGGKLYSREELTAEMGAAFLCAHAGIDNEIDNSVAYLQGWINKLREDSKILFKAAADAQKAADFILGSRKD